VSTTLTLAEVAQFLRVHPSTVYRMLKRHDIPAFKVGSDYRFTKEAIERWTKKQSESFARS
jgi:excisionase family DNA binding protein